MFVLSLNGHQAALWIPTATRSVPDREAERVNIAIDCLAPPRRVINQDQ